jgi:hypothetical protein
MVIRVGGGLGNQMFQYVFYKYLKQSGINASLDISFFSTVNENSHIKYKLDYFKLDDLNTVSFESCIEMIDFAEYSNLIAVLNSDLEIKFKVRGIVRKIIRSIFKVAKIPFKVKGTHYIEWEEHDLHKIFNRRDNLYVQGYFQKYKYADSIRDDILSDFSFNFDLSDYMKSILEDIENNYSISMHIRRGDYLGKKEFTICTMQYYLNAIEYLKSINLNGKYYLFSDDIKWAKDNFSFLEDYLVVDTSLEKFSDLCDLYLMTKTKNNIIANSTFSWWGAWLNTNPNKIVIAPDKWLGGKLSDRVHIDEICPPDWIRVSTQ